MNKLQKISLPIAVTGAIAAGPVLSGCSSSETDPNVLHNNGIAETKLGGLANAELGRLALNAKGNLPTKPADAPISPNESWASLSPTIINPTTGDKCNVSVTARVNEDGSFGGWTSDGINNRPAVTTVDLSGAHARVTIRIPDKGSVFVKPPKLTVDGTTYDTNPKKGEKRLTFTEINAAAEEASTILDLCGVPKPTAK